MPLIFPHQDLKVALCAIWLNPLSIHSFQSLNVVHNLIVKTWSKLGNWWILYDYPCKATHNPKFRNVWSFFNFTHNQFENDAISRHLQLFCYILPIRLWLNCIIKEEFTQGTCVIYLVESICSFLVHFFFTSCLRSFTLILFSKSYRDCLHFWLNWNICSCFIISTSQILAICP